MTDPTAMLDAHVQFELARWSGSRFEEGVREEVDAFLAWLSDVPLAELLPPDQVARSVADLVTAMPVTDELLELASAASAAAHNLLREQEGALGDLVHADDVDAAVTVLARMEDVRRGVIDAVTESEAYTRLVSHVLYHGLKSFALTENVLARRIPGASSLVRLGQRGLNNAAPGLEANLDRQLTAFVRANIADTLRDSRRFLEDSLDDDLLRAMAEQTWEGARGSSVGSLAERLDPVDLAELVVVSGPVVRRLRDGGLLGELAARMVSSVWEEHGDRPVADLLDVLGWGADELTEHGVALLRPVVGHALATGFLEARVRARLEPFYASYDADRPRRTTRRPPRST